VWKGPDRRGNFPVKFEKGWWPGVEIHDKFQGRRTGRWKDAWSWWEGGAQGAENSGDTCIKRMNGELGQKFDESGRGGFPCNSNPQKFQKNLATYNKGIDRAL